MYTVLYSVPGKVGRPDRHGRSVPLKQNVEYLQLDSPTALTEANIRFTEDLSFML